MARISIASEGDFSATGKQATYLRGPHSVRRSASGWFAVPVTCTLHGSGMLPDDQPDAARGTRELNAQGSVHAHAAGLFEPLKSSGDDVEVGEAVGLVQHPDTSGSEPDEITSPDAGIASCKRAMVRVARGDSVFQIASDAEPKADQS